MLLDQVSQPPQQPTTLGRWHTSPSGTVECTPRRIDRSIDVFRVRFRDSRDHAFIGWIDDVNNASTSRWYELTID
jgi:hypothetical protein